jgi:hypothetical protein
MSKFLVYYGNFNRDSHLFSKNIDKELFDNLKLKISKICATSNNYELSKYYTIDTIYEIVNKQKYYKIEVDNNMNLINNNYISMKYSVKKLDYIIPEFEYFNIQHYKNCSIYNVDNICIVFGEYIEDGLTYYEIWTKTDNPHNFLDKFLEQ